MKRNTFVILRHKENPVRVYGRFYSHRSSETVQQLLATVSWPKSYDIMATLTEAEVAAQGVFPADSRAHHDAFAREFLARGAQPAIPTELVMRVDAATAPTTEPKRPPLNWQTHTPFDPFKGFFDKWDMTVGTYIAAPAPRSFGAFVSPDEKPTENLIDPSYAMAAERSR